MILLRSELGKTYDQILPLRLPTHDRFNRFRLLFFVFVSSAPVFTFFLFIFFVSCRFSGSGRRRWSVGHPSTARIDRIYVEIGVTWREYGTAVHVGRAPKTVDVLAGPGGVASNLICVAPTELVRDDKDSVIYLLKHTAQETGLAVIERLFTGLHNVEHVGAHDWVVNVSVDQAREEHF